MYTWKDQVAVVTGAASGIGSALAQQLAAAGAQVVLADVDRENLEQIAQAIQRSGGLTSVHVVDVSDRAAVYGLADAVIDRFGGVHVVVNNAGVALSNVTVEHLAYEDLEWVLGINLWGVIYGTKAFLPHLLKQPAAHLVNVSSTFGLTACARAAAYSTSKFAVRGFTEALRQELRGTPVVVTVVFPGGVRTHIARHSRRAQSGEPIAHPQDAVRQFEQGAQVTPDEAAAQIKRGIERNAPRVLIGKDARLLDMLARLRPGAYDTFMLEHVVQTYKK